MKIPPLATILVEPGNLYFNLGGTPWIFLRMIENQIKAGGSTPALADACEKTRKHFEEQASELETRLDYQVIPIQKLVRMQLASALIWSTAIGG